MAEDGLSHRLARVLKAPAARPFVKPVYESLVATQLAAIRRFDDLRGPSTFDFHDVTALIKTFERPRVLDRLLESLKRVYPKLAILVVDDSAVPRVLEGPGLRTLALPYDTDVAEGRNRGLALVRTELFLLLDDDFVVTRLTNLEEAVQAMRANAEIDILGGQIFDLPRWKRGVTVQDRLRLGGNRERRAQVGGFPVYDWVCNFYVGRTDRIRNVGWDPRLKRVEHSDFFMRAHQQLLTAYSLHFRALHVRTPFDDRYMKKRLDVEPDLALLRRKWGG